MNTYSYVIHVSVLCYIITLARYSHWGVSLSPRVYIYKGSGLARDGTPCRVMARRAASRPWAWAWTRGTAPAPDGRSDGQGPPWARAPQPSPPIEKIVFLVCRCYLRSMEGV